MLLQNLKKRRSIRFSTPAKLNLFLDVLGKRADGYHEVSTVMCVIDLWDDLEIELRRDGKIELEMHLPQNPGSDDAAWHIPDDSSNLVYRAAVKTQQQLATELGCNIRLTKRIPAAAGLGGGSSNAAATIVGCQILWAAWNRPDAAQICQDLGSDLNFFLGSPQGFGLTHATGRGELGKLLGCRTMLSFWLTHPPQGCSTKEVYARVRQLGCPSKTEEFLATCQTGQESKIGAAMFNALQLPASEINDWIECQLQLLKECGCKQTLMSGSGSSCFGIVPHGGSFEYLESQANRIGINRVYQVTAWYGNSIERQLSQYATG
jgi:4-diphosphocytidyl-2-C-methyl-D-erythritol kinase